MPGLHRGDDSTKTDFSGFSLFVCLVEQNTNIPYICVCCLLRQDFLLVCLFVCADGIQSRSYLFVCSSV